MSKTINYKKILLPIVILVVTEDGTVQEFVKDKNNYLDALVESVAEWRRRNEVSNIPNSTAA